MTKKETVKLLYDSMVVLEKIVVPHRLLQKQLDGIVMAIEEEILIEVLDTDIGDHVQTLDNPMEFIVKWCES